MKSPEVLEEIHHCMTHDQDPGRYGPESAGNISLVDWPGGS